MSFKFIKWYLKKMIDNLDLKIMLIFLCIFWILISQSFVDEKYRDIQYSIQINQDKLNAEKLIYSDNKNKLDIALFYSEFMVFLGGGLFAVESINFNNNKIFINFIGGKKELSIFTNSFVNFLNQYRVRIISITFYNISQKEVKVQMELRYD
ncbi:hypothetical protein [Acinetobacter bereziniae]|uniref:hypothetical protein n=1 Tax=Acinetobacter bereziniae TaxID=106648 RepID=UPI00124FC061|nr:hypothetical protein [Acinetobacter bereziniae]